MTSRERPYLTLGASFAVGILFSTLLGAVGIAPYDVPFRWLDKGNPEPSYPVSAPTPGGGARVLTLGEERSCALMRDGSVWCWGAPWLAEVPADAPRPGWLPKDRVPTKVREPGDRTQFVFGQAGVCEVDSHATAFCVLPSGERAMLDDTEQVAVGDDHGCLVRRGELWCWGDNSAGQLFGEGASPSRAPSLRLDASFAVSHVALSRGITCVARRTGEILCRGGSIADAGTPHKAQATISAKADAIQELVASDRSACVRRTSGTVECWAVPENGDASVGDWEGPKLVPLPVRAKQIAASFRQTCALLVNAQVTCWDRALQATSGTQAGGPEARPFLEDAVELAVSGGHGCLASTAGDVFCWGNNENRQVSAYTKFFLHGRGPKAGGPPTWSEAPSVPIPTAVYWLPSAMAR